VRDALGIREDDIQYAGCRIRSKLLEANSSCRGYGSCLSMNENKVMISCRWMTATYLDRTEDALEKLGEQQTGRLLDQASLEDLEQGS